jgi:hypothetical protein
MVPFGRSWDGVSSMMVVRAASTMMMLTFIVNAAAVG